MAADMTKDKKVATGTFRDPHGDGYWCPDVASIIRADGTAYVYTDLRDSAVIADGAGISVLRQIEVEMTND